MRQITACLASAAIALGAASVAGPALAADDMGSNPITEFFDSLGMGEKEKPDIDYKERAPLVPPSSNASLPPPQAKGPSRADDAWPSDPDAQARAERKARANELPTETYNARIDRNSRLSPGELQGRRTAGAGAVTETGGSTTYDNTITRMSPDELKSQRMNRTADAAPAGSRSRLSDPPPGYLVGNGVSAQVKPEAKPWYGRLFGN
ncbi:MAG TPA: hypothetical protein VGC51_12600 [Hansschlegelia sp.]